MNTNANTTKTRILSREVAVIHQMVTSAVKSLKIGKTWVGAFGEATKMGLERGTTDYNLFSIMFLHMIPKTIITKDGVIVRLADWPTQQ